MKSIRSVLGMLACAAMFAIAVGCQPPAEDVDTSVDTSTDPAPVVQPADSNVTTSVETPDSNLTTGVETPDSNLTTGVETPGDEPITEDETP